MPIRFVMLAESRCRSSGSISPQHFLERKARSMEDLHSLHSLCCNSRPRSDTAFAVRYNELSQTLFSAP